MAEFLIISWEEFSKNCGSIIATSANNPSSWKLCFFPFTFSTEIRVTSLPLPKVVGIKILNFFNFNATNLATSNELPPPSPIIWEKFESLKSEII